MRKNTIMMKPGAWFAVIALSLAPQASLAEQKATTDHSNQVDKAGSVAFEGHNWSDTSPELTDTNVTMELGGDEEQVGAGGYMPEPLVDEVSTSEALETDAVETSCVVRTGVEPETGTATVETTTTGAVEPSKYCDDATEAVPKVLSDQGELVPIGEGVPTADLLVERLSERRASLEGRETSLLDREALLQAAEKRLDERAAALTQQLAALEGATAAAAELDNRDLQNLIAMYEMMKPSQAAAIFDELDASNLKLIAQAMNPRKLAPIMAKMDPATAATLTLGMAE